jgi:hypothetical protein
LVRIQTATASVDNTFLTFVSVCDILSVTVVGARVHGSLRHFYWVAISLLMLVWIYPAKRSRNWLLVPSAGLIELAAICELSPAGRYFLTAFAVLVTELGVSP